MKSISGDLQALFDSGNPFIMADLYQFTLVDGTVARYTNFDVDIAWSGNTYYSGLCFIDRSQLHWKNDFSVDTLNLTLIPDVTNGLINSVPILTALHDGQFDGATLILTRVFMTAGAVYVGAVSPLFSGRVGEIKVDRTKAEVPVNSWLELLNTPMPRNLYEMSCGSQLYDTYCSVNKTAYTDYSSVISYVNTTKLVFKVSIAQAAGYYDYGMIAFTSGACSGIKRSIRSYDGDKVITLFLPLPAVPGSGDAFWIVPGCDKTKATCNSKFNNKVNFRGFPYIPAAEMAI